MCTSYDSRGRWVREDRPEMLSDRLGYPAEVGDEDWKRVAATRKQPEMGACEQAPQSGGGR